MKQQFDNRPTEQNTEKYVLNIDPLLHSGKNSVGIISAQ